MADAAISPLHRLWRGLPQGPRRRVLGGAAGLLAPRPDQPPPPARPGLAVVGEFDRASGLGEGARLTVAGLEALGLPHWTAGPGRTVPPPGVPLVLHLNPASIPLSMLRLGRSLVRGRRIVGVWPWELPRVPAPWRAGFGYVHRVWAPSRFSAAAIEAAAPPGFAPGGIAVVPYPVACDMGEVAPFPLVALGIPEGAVVTLVVFNLASSFARKNPLGAIAAHRAAFGARMDRVLLLRVGNPGDHPADFALLRDAARDLPNVRFDTLTRPRHEARAILAACDILLSLHRSEGFGLVPAEAILLGRAVVATAWSGTEDFLDDAWAVRVPARLVPAQDPRGVFEAPGAVWADPDLDATVMALRRLADDPAERARLGTAARTAGRARLGPEALGAAVRALMDDGG